MFFVVVSSSPQNLLLWFHDYTLEALHPPYRNCAAQVGIASEEVLGPDAHSLPTPSWLWLHSALLRDLWCSSKGAAIKPSTRQADLQQVREDVDKGFLINIAERCSALPKATLPANLCKYCTSVKTITHSNVSMQGVGLEYMRRKIAFPVNRKYIGN